MIEEDKQREEAVRELMANMVLADRNLQAHPRLAFAISNHVNIRGEKMQFHDKPYLVAIYTDNAPEICLQSSVQTGKSEFLIVGAHSWAERGLQVLYVLPTIDIRNLFVANRVDKLYRQPHYAQQIADAKGDSNSRGLKHFGPNNGAIFFAGSNSETTFIEKPIDLVIGDEIDRFDQANYEKADDRMTASPYKLKYEASNPTVDKFGINARYLLSDQRQWFVKCDHCGRWQIQDWFKNVVRQTDDNRYLLLDTDWEQGCGRDIYLMCRHCVKPLNRFDIRGAWVPRRPSVKDTHGYHIHQMMSSFVRIDRMYQRFNRAQTDDTKMQVFYNSDLGLPFAGAGSKITLEMLNNCKENYLMPPHAERCFMGVDVGKVLHVTIYQLCPGERLRAVFIGTVKEFEDLDILMNRYEIVSYVIDAMPETRKATEYAKKYTARGWMCRYIHGLMEVQKNDDTRIITADRTMLMDRVLSWFAQRKFILPTNAQSLDGGDYYDHLSTPTRIYDEDKERYDWLGSPDHYFHSSLYALLAYIVRGEITVLTVDTATNAVMAAQVKELPKVLNEDSIFPPGTPEGLKEHYRRMYDRLKQQTGEISNGGKRK